MLAVVNEVTALHWHLRNQFHAHWLDPRRRFVIDDIQCKSVSRTAMAETQTGPWRAVSGIIQVECARRESERRQS